MSYILLKGFFMILKKSIKRCVLKEYDKKIDLIITF